MHQVLNTNLNNRGESARDMQFIGLIFLRRAQWQKIIILVDYVYLDSVLTKLPKVYHYSLSITASVKHLCPLISFSAHQTGQKQKKLKNKKIIIITTSLNIAHKLTYMMFLECISHWHNYNIKFMDELGYFRLALYIITI